MTLNCQKSMVLTGQDFMNKYLKNGSFTMQTGWAIWSGGNMETGDWMLLCQKVWEFFCQNGWKS